MRSLKYGPVVAIMVVLSLMEIYGSSVLQVPTGTWQSNPMPMSAARTGAASALLPSGQVLVTGGDPGTGPLASVDFFKTDGTITAAPPMAYARSHHVSVTLQDGRVLVAGGLTAGGSATNTAEIYDPAANSWTSIGAVMIEARSGATAAVLQDGRVVVAGGQNGTTISPTIEIFDPAANTFTSAGTMSSPRSRHAMAVLQDGRVLIVGGNNGTAPVASTDIFDPVAGTVSAGPSLATARFGHSATTLLNGQVVVIGGNNGNSNPAQMDVMPAELVDFTAATPAFTTLATNLATPREGHLAFLLPNNNNVLIVGGTSGGATVASAELFTAQETPQDVWTYGFGSTGTMTTARSSAAGSANQVNGPSTIMQRNGVLMVAGGTDANGNALNTTEAYGYPTVQTDQSDYPPFTTVTITGSGFQPGETVTLSLVESPLIDTGSPFTTVADANGNFSDNSFATDSHDVNVRFFLTAMGQTSGFQAQNTFTDSKPSTVTLNPTSVTVAPTVSAQYTVTVGFGGNGNSCTSPLSIQTPPSLPTGASASFSPASVTNTSPTSTLTITTTNATPPGSTTFTVLAGNGAGCQAGTATGTGTLVVVENTTTTLTSSINPTVFGQSTTLTATVAQVTGPTTPTSGTVTFKDGTTTLGTGTLAAGVATLSTSALTVAGSPHSLTASYAGVADSFGASTSNTVSQVVNQASTTTSVTSSQNPSAFGQSVTFTATVTDSSTGSTGTPTGTVTFKDGTTTLGTGTLNGSGVATFSTSSLAVASHSITAAYGGDTNFTTSTSNTLTQTVNQASTATALTSSANPSVFGQSVTFTATVTVNSPGTGTIPAGETVTFKDGGTAIGTGTTNASGVATFATSTLAVATHTITAVYAGDTNFATSTSGGVSQVVNQASTTATITAHTPNPSVVGQPITVNFTVTVNSPGSGTIPGTDSVTVSDGTGDSCTGTFAAGTCQLTATTSGAKTLTATFASDANFATSTSAGVAHTVNEAPTITSVNNATYKVGTAGSFTVTATGFPAAMTFSETGTLPSGVTLSAAGLLSGTPAANTGGTYPISITASNGVSPSATQNFTLTVNQAPAITSAASAAFIVNTAGSFTVTATGFPAPTFSETGTLPSGVTLTSGGVLSGTATATGSFPITITASNGITPNATQSFTLTVGQAPAITSANNTAFTVLTAGLFTVTATGSPAPTFSETGALPSGVTFTSAGVLSGTPASGTAGSFPIIITATNGVGTNATQSFTLTVNKLTPVFSPALTSPAAISYGTATVSLPPNSPMVESAGMRAASPDTVTITINGVSSAPIGFNGSSGTFGPINFPTSTIPVGTYTITYTYSEGTNFNSITDSSTTLTVNKANQTITVTTPAPATAVYNSSFTVAATASSGLAVTFSSSGVCSNVGATFTMTSGTGTCTVKFDQAGNSNYGAATEVTESVTAQQAAATVVLSNLTQTYTGSPLSPTVTTTPTGLSFSLTGAPDTNAGSYSVTATVTDPNYQGSTSGTFLIYLAPSITSAPRATFTAAVAGSFTVTTMAFPTARLSETGALPAGVSFTDNGNGTATLAGTATVAGSYPLTITAANGVGIPAAQTFTLTVSPGAFAQLQLLVPGETAAPGTTSGKTGTPNTEYVNGAFNVTVNAVDANWNVVNTVTDTVQIASSDTHAVLPGNVALVAGTGTLSVTLVTPENPAATTITASDATDSSKTPDTSPAIEVVVVYTASISPSSASNGASTAYTLTVNNAAAPNTNSLKSVTVAIPANGGTPSAISVTATNPGPTPANWILDPNQIAGFMRFRECTATDACNGAGTNDLGPGGSITIQFTTAANESISNAAVNELWTTTAFSDSAYANPLPLAGTEPTVAIGQAPALASGNSTSFTVNVSGNFTVSTTGVPTSALGETGNLPSGVTFKDNGDGTGTLSGTPAAGTAARYPISFTATNGILPNATQSFTLTVINPATTTMVQSSKTPSTYGDLVTFTATVTSASGTPTGSVTFIDGATCPGAALTGSTPNPATLSSGVATFSTSALAAGSHTITACYTPTGIYLGSSGSVTQTANAAATTTSLSAPTVIYPANGIVIVTVSSGAGTPTGNATLVVDGGTPLFASMNGGVATFTLTSPGTGVHTLSASYAAQGNFAASGPTAGTLTVDLAPSITSAASTTFTAAVAGSFTVTTMGFPAPGLSETGALPAGVSFTDNGNGTATLAGRATVAGSYPLTITAANGVGIPAAQTFTLTVSPGAFAQLQLLVPGETAAPGTTSGKTGTPNTEYVNGAFNVTVNAVDANWNVVNTVTDTVQIASSDTHAVLPGNAALVAGTGTLSVTLETPENPAATTITASDATDSSKTSDTSPAIEVVVVYTASISPNMASNGASTPYTLTVTNSAAPNTNTLRSVTVAVPTNGGTPSAVSVTATNPRPTAANWSVDLTQLPGSLRFTQNTVNDGIGPGGTISIQFTTTANESVSNTVVNEVWTTTAFSDSAYTNPLPLTGTEPTVAIGQAPVITSANSTSFTYGAAGTFTVTATGVPTPTLTESGSLPSGVTFTDNGDGTATLAGTPGAAGSFPLTITAHNGYGADGTQSFTLTVNKATATVTLSNLTQTYTGSALTPTATTSPVGLTIVWTGAPDTNAGSYQVTATVNDPNYQGSASGTFIINKAAAAVALSNLTQTYTGSALTPTATTSPVGLTIVWTGAPDTNAGSYPVTATVNDPNYQGSASGTFIINKAAASVTLSNLTQTYTGSALTPTATTSPVGLTIVWTGAPDTNAGSYPVTATVNDPNYQGSASGTFIINKAAASVTLSNLTQTYTGSPLTPTATTSPVGLTIIWTGAPDTNAGSYPVTATVNDPNYQGSASGTFIINKAAASVTLSNLTQTYTGSPLTPTATTNPVGLTIVWTGAPDTNAGSYPVTATVNDPNYQGTASGTFIINKAAAAVTLSNLTQTYTGSPLTPTATTSPVGLTIVWTGAPDTNAGSYPVTATVNDPNYQGTASGTFIINKAAAAVTLSNLTQTYTGSPLTPTATTSPVGLTIVWTGAPDTNAGSYQVTATVNDPNYQGSASGTFIINKAAASVTLSNLTQTYTGSPLTPTATTNPVGLTIVWTGAPDTNAGSYPVTATVNDPNYQGSASGTFIINKAAATVTPNTASKVYGTADPAFTGTLTGFLAADGVTATYTRTAGQTVAGSPYTISAMLSPAGALGNYNITYNTANFTITPAQLTITASSGTMIYGGPVFPVSPSYSGFVNGDTPASLTAQPTCGTTATSLSPVTGNPYTSTCPGAVDSNYMISYPAGIVTVTQATTTTGMVTSSVNPSAFMQLVTLTTTVTPQYSGTTPTGAVTFYNNGSQIGTGTLSPISCGTPPCPDQATFSTSSLPDSGPDSITAAYGGDNNFTGSMNSAITQTVQPAPDVSLSPLAVSFGNQNVNTASQPATVTITNTGDATLNISSSGISITPNTDFAQTNNCGSSLAATKSCTITITFTPVATGIRTASIQITDNDDDTVNAKQIVSLTGAGLSTIAGGSLYTDTLFATANGCGSFTASGGSSVDSFNSAQGYSSSHQLSGGNVGTNGNVTLNGNSVIYGSAAVDSMTIGNCNKTTVTGLTTSGGAKVTGGLVALNGPITYPAAPAPNPAPPTTTQNISGSCGTISGCTNETGNKTVSLAPGQYGNLNFSGGTTAHVSQGTYNVNSLTLSGNSILYVDSGPVIVKLAGASLSGGNPAMDLSGGSIQNPSGIPANLQFAYAGSQGLNLSGGSGSYATVYAPNALVNMSGGSDFFGSIIGSTITDSGGTAIHYDTNLPNIHAGDYIWFNAVVNNLKGLPSGSSPAQVKLYLTNSTIQFTANGVPYSMPVPNAVVTFNSTSQSSGAKTAYDLTNNRWNTAVAASGLTGNTFVAGLAFQVPAGGFPSGIQNVTWSASFSTDVPGITLQWQWGAAVYASFSTTYATTTPSNSNVLGVNAEDGSANTNGADPAGTPETYKASVIFGATGGGGTNYTGYFSPGSGVVPTIAPMSSSPSSLAFGPQNQGTVSGAMTTVLTNNDGVSHTISSITITGTNASDFTQANNCPISPNTLASGSSCTVTVTFTPSDVATRTAKIAVTDDANNSPQTVYLSGTGQAP